MLPLPRLNFTGKPDAWITCLSGLESAGRKRTSVTAQRAVLRLYLSGFDHFVKRELCCPGFVRYVDDALLFADNKQLLWAWRRDIVDRMATLRLTIHPGAQPRPTSDGFGFLGFVVYPTHRRLKGRKVAAYRRKLKNLVANWVAGKETREAVVASLLGWINHARYGDTWGIRRQIVKLIPGRVP